ncbi:gas vesicle protein GvpG [Falsiroseomonas sp. E2-1-a20]|uniref:gas vesicle protein GvpG n=1 Tax=Falsiroseomonas sp. E2-1-a20 TaxID=3239300 RepID=UPI003F383130
MGLFKLLTLPVALPLGGIEWLARRVDQAVDAQWNDPKRIESALIALERRLEAGEIDEAAFEAAEAGLLRELREMRARLAAQAP